MRLTKRFFSCGLLLTFAARAAEPPPPPPSEDPGPWTLRVHLLTSDERVELRRVVDDALICKAPCGAELQFHESDTFVLTGSGVSRSNTFEFRPRDGEVTLRVSSGSVVPKVIGAILLVVGATLAVDGGLAYAASSIPVSDNCSSNPACSTNSTAGILALIGLGLAIAGGIVLLQTHVTTYTVEQ
jgi:hypothetical protein